MRRRELVVALGVAALAGALAASRLARAQAPGRVYRLGVLEIEPRTSANGDAFFDELRRLGFVEGQNLQVEGRFAEPATDAEKDTAALVAAKVDAILVSGRIALGVQRATRTIPILALANDLVAMGLAASFARPGGNMTGISLLATELDGKRQSLLMELVPAARHIAALTDPAVTAPAQLRALEDAARTRGVALSIHPAATPDEIAPAIDAAKAAGAQALNVLASVLFERNHRLIVERADALKLPAIYQWPQNAEDGGFAAYGPSYVDLWRQRARQLAKILRGANPADIPVEQPDKIELVINQKVAKALGLTVPHALLAQADEVIE
ncbi:MAG TPA: ABC transporter substrate-binding protein [Stellaceae bacterium]|jgi:putative ABC transport system substrate-binding protein|nr:ABC transporter substrate-binding protein [Stellaceae bacterium]